MTFLLKKWPRKIILLFALSLIIFLIDFSFIFNPLKGWTQELFSPIRQYFYGLGRHYRQQSSEKEKDCFLSNQQWEEKLSRCQENNISAQQIFDENQRLRRLLGAPLPPSLKFSDANVIGRQGVYIIINKGKEDNVFERQLVLSANYLVGRVEEVEEKQAKILPINAARFSLPVLIFSDKSDCIAQNKSCQHGKGVLRGHVIKEILLGEPVVEGDLVTPLEGPAGILVGQVVKVSKSANGVFKEAEIAPFLDIKSLVEVFLVRQ